MFQVTISGRHVAVTDAMREHARERLSKLERVSSHIMNVRVTLSIESDRHAAEVIAAVRSKGDIVGKHESHDMYLSIDQAAIKVEKQLQKVEARFKDRRDSGKGKETIE